jgi:hypothetical protein
MLGRVQPRSASLRAAFGGAARPRPLAGLTRLRSPAQGAGLRREGERKNYDVANLYNGDRLRADAAARD